MKLSKFFQLKKILEIQPFQSSFLTLKNVLYYFAEEKNSPKRPSLESS
jgi:hypothetical protein